MSERLTASVWEQAIDNRVRLNGATQLVHAKFRVAGKGSLVYFHLIQVILLATNYILEELNRHCIKGR
jgi:hypothetical protein